jgi:hypothetical protein
MMVSYSWPEGTSVNYVGVTNILEMGRTPDDAGVTVTMSGLVYFADGSNVEDVPSEYEMALLIEEDALPGSSLVEELSYLFPTLTEASVQMEPSATQAPSVSSAVATDSPSVAATEALTTSYPTFTPTDAPSTVDVTTFVPTITDTNSIATAEPPSTSNKESKQPTLVIPATQPTSTLVIPASPGFIDANDDGDEGDASDLTATQAEQQQQEQQNASNEKNDTISIAVVAGCAVAGLVVLAIMVALVVFGNKERKRRKSIPNFNKRKSAMGGATTAASTTTTKKYRTSSEYGGDDDEEHLVQISVCDIIDFDDIEDISRNEAGSWDWKPSTGSGTAATGAAGTANATSSPQKTVSTANDEDSSEDGSLKKQRPVNTSMESTGSSSSVMGFWASLFHRMPSGDAAEDSPPAAEMASVASSSDVENNNNYDNHTNAGTEISDFDGVVSVEPKIVTSEVNSLGQQTYVQDSLGQQTRVVKKDTIESPEILTPAAKINSWLNYNGDEEEEERQRQKAMMPNPYVQRSSSDGHVKRSAATQEKVSAETLAKNHALAHHASFAGFGKQGMVPKKAWWRPNSSPTSEQKEAENTRAQVKPPTKASPSTGHSDDDDSLFGPASADLWDPNDSEVGSLATNEEIFEAKVENKGQEMLQSSLRNESARTQRSFTLTDPAQDQQPLSAKDRYLKAVSSQAYPKAYAVDQASQEIGYISSDDESSELRFDSTVSL